MLIKEYGFDNKPLHDAIKKIYDYLMKYKEYDKAVTFAKKYGL